jgi:ketose-bisphosphate aldolase
MTKMIQKAKEKKGFVGVGDIMRMAFREHIVVPAFNIPYLPMIEAVADTLQKTGTFALVEVARPDVEKFGAESFEAVAKEYRRVAKPEFVRLHMDHIPVVDEDYKRADWEPLIRLGLELGYDSVMVDGSRLPLEENIAITRKAVAMAMPYGTPVEAELGAVMGHEAGPMPPYEELFRSKKGFTAPADAERFVRETGVDWLSVAVGNFHGAISGALRDVAKVEARLDIEHLKKLAEITGVPIVLHGGSGINRECVLEAVKNGITKINVGTQLRQEYEKALRQKPNDIENAKRAVSELVRWFVEDYFCIKESAYRLIG